MFLNKISLAIIACIFVINTQLSSQDVKWATHVAPVLYDNCTSCHHNGGLAPFSLMTYEDAYEARFDILGAVESRTMPPWPPDPHYSALAFPRYLSSEDIQTITDWVNQGSQAGNPADAPTPPVYSNEGFITNPDLDLTMPSYTSPAIGEDIYRCFPIPTGISAEKFITQFECIPGNPEIVHHVLVFQTTDQSVYQLDANDPGPGYTGFGGVGVSADLIGAWVPGSQPFVYPPNMGVKLEANSIIVLQIHYPAGSNGQQDATSVRMKLANGPMRPVFIDPLLNHITSLDNGPLIIPANQVKTFYSSFNTGNYDATLISAAPHMHLVGKSIKAWAEPPSGDLIPLINIPNWDFHWQGTYPFRKLLKIPANTTVRGEAVYDNTSNNHHNPNDPPQTVFLGEATTDEMMLIYFAYTLYFPGDENIVIDPNEPPILSSIKPAPDRPSLTLNVSPNPAVGDIVITFDLPASTTGDLDIFDTSGRKLLSVCNNRNFQAGPQQLNCSLSELPAGQYFIRLSATDWYGINSVVKQ